MTIQEMYSKLHDIRMSAIDEFYKLIPKDEFAFDTELEISDDEGGYTVTIKKAIKHDGVLYFVDKEGYEYGFGDMNIESLLNLLSDVAYNKSK